MSLRLTASAVLAAGVLALSCGAGCGASDNAGNGTRPSVGSGRVQVVASFYPLQWVTEQVTGGGATVDSLTKPGAEPHDAELTPQDVEKVAEADLVVYLNGFQPAVDAAISQEAAGRAYDVAAAANLTLRYTPIEDGEQHRDEAGARDPHFWLDPLRLASVADALAARLGSGHPGQAARFRSRAEAVTAQLRTLDRDYRTGLLSCRSKVLVTGHNAFGYLAQRYGLTQVGITGLSPEVEPKPADLTRVADFVVRHKVRTIYYETLASPNVARTVAAETGARVALLDPIEGLTQASQGDDYLQVMRSNLATLKRGQPCP